MAYSFCFQLFYNVISQSENDIKRGKTKAELDFIH